MNVLSHIFVLLRKKCVLYTKVCNKIVRTYARGYFTAKLVLRNDLKGDDNLLDGRIQEFGEWTEFFVNSASGRKKTRRVETDDSPNSASERNSVFGFRRDSASRRVVGLPLFTNHSPFVTFKRQFPSFLRKFKLGKFKPRKFTKPQKL